LLLQDVDIATLSCENDEVASQRTRGVVGSLAIILLQLFSRFWQ